MGRADEPAYKLRKERERVRTSDMSDDDREAVLKLLSALDANDPRETYTNENGTHETLTTNSLVTYSRNLRMLAEASERDLLDHTLDSLSDVFGELLDELSVETVRQRQAAATKFHRYHDTGVDPDEIPITPREDDQSVDERDILDRDDIDAIRDACLNARDRCLIELLVYTGQRIRALQTLRIKDIDLDEGVYYLNTEAEGLKGAADVGKRRPLLGAENAVREWLDRHPTGERDDYLISALPSATNTGEAGEYLSLPAIRRQLKNIGERADVDKPVHPHAFRHTFVTTAIREYDMDPATVKHLIGHGADSTVMESTYQHLTDDDHIEAARRATDAGREPSEPEGTLTPETCPTCNDPLPNDAKACPRCGTVFTPDAKGAKDRLEDDATATMVDADDRDVREAAKELKDLVDENPELLEALIDERQDSSGQ